MLLIFLFHHENISCGYSLEASRRDASNEHHNKLFRGEIKEILPIFGKLKIALSVAIKCSIEKDTIVYEHVQLNEHAPTSFIDSKLQMSHSCVKAIKQLNFYGIC